jgi:putative FmdB family regulatory protein
MSPVPGVSYAALIERRGTGGSVVEAPNARLAARRSQVVRAWPTPPSERPVEPQRESLRPVLAFSRLPIYEYKCPEGHVFEVFQRMSEPPPEACAICERGPVEKVLYPVAVHFKGSGFYSTDYGRGSRKRDAKESEAPSTSDDGGKKEEKKPAEA